MSQFVDLCKDIADTEFWKLYQEKWKRIYKTHKTIWLLASPQKDEEHADYFRTESNFGFHMMKLWL